MRIAGVYETDLGWWVSTKLLFYFQLVMSVFLLVIVSSLFGEICRPEALTYFRTLPLSVFQVWTVRYLRLLFLLYIIIIPPLLISVYQLNIGIHAFLEMEYEVAPTVSVSMLPIVVSCLLFVNFYILAIQAAIIVVKNSIIASGIMLAYTLMEMGPWGRFMADNALFYGSFGPIQVQQKLFPNTCIVIGASFVLLIVVGLWYHRNFAHE